MHLFYAIGFFFLTAMGETLRHGIFALTPVEISALVHAVMIGMALFILRADLVFLLRPPGATLYDRSELIWTWRQTFIGLLLAPAVFTGPVIWALASGQSSLLPVSPTLFMDFSTLMALGSVLAQALLLREAVIKAFAPSLGYVFVVSGLSTFIFFMPDGVQQALIATAFGMFFLVLRVRGTHLLVTALIHGLSLIVLRDVVSAGVTDGQSWTHTGVVCGATVLVACAIWGTKPRPKAELGHA